MKAERISAEKLRWMGFTGRLQNAESEHAAKLQYRIGYCIADGLVKDFEEKYGPYLEAQAEFVGTENDVRAWIGNNTAKSVRRAERAISAAKDVIAQPPVIDPWLSAQEKKAAKEQHKKACARARDTIKNLTAEIKSTVKEAKILDSSPCTGCPAYALCAKQTLACRAFVTYLSSGRYSDKKRSVPSAQMMVIASLENSDE